MPTDMAIIKKIENQIGRKLEPLPFDNIMGYRNRGYWADDTGQVKGLNLFDTKFTGISFLRHLTGLTHLALRNSRIKDLTPLSELTQLTTLYLCESQINNLEPLGKLTNLKMLNLAINKISDLTPLRKLKRLVELHLWENQIVILTPLRELMQLTSINLGRNQIADLTPLSNLTQLTTINLEGNQVTDLTPLSNLTQLTTINLGGNQVADLTPLRELMKLKEIDLRNNKITHLPSDITQWWPGMEIEWEDSFYISDLNLYHNPLVNPPVEIVKQGKVAIQNYFEEIEHASVLFLESKLLLVGSGDVGKTTLMKKLKDNAFHVEVGKEDTTRGIDIQPWQLSCSFNDRENRDVKIHFWDFGGQEILHATHQFFLTKRSLYIFVWDPRKEEIQSFDYWLNAVKLLGAESPVIVVMNKAELRTKQIAESSYKKKFPNIQGFLQVSCVTGHRIPELTDTIRTALSGMPHLLDKLPKRWMEIRDALKGMERDWVTLDHYFEGCRSYGMEEEKAIFLIDYLHDLGIILHFRMDPVLTDTVILNPEWATGAVYALIDSLNIQNDNGKFTSANLGQYWDTTRYPTNKHPHLLRLMEKFELCFNIVGTDDYIIPELLQAERFDIDFASYHSAGNLHFHYSYDFMPAGIITRFISRIHYLIRHDHYWKNGVELTFYGSYALMVSDPVQKRIRVSVSGQSPVQLMAVIRSHFDHIHETLNMKKEEYFHEEIPCTCPECSKSEKPYFFKYKTLQKFKSKNRDAVCELSAEDVSIQGLLEGLLPLGKQGNLFDKLVTIASQIQGISKTLQPDENSRNTVAALLLGAIGFHVKDQSLWSRSASGKRLGELDIKIEDETGRTISIIEAFNLVPLGISSTPVF